MNHRLGPRAMSQKELQKFFASVTDTRDQLAFRLGYTYAMRVGEIVRVQLKDVHQDRIMIQGIKNGRVGYYPLSNEMKELLRKWLKVRPDRGEFLFPTEQNNGNHISRLTLQKRFYGYCRDAGISYYSIHSLRHTRCMELVSGDQVNPYEVMAFVRHKTLGMVLNYIRDKQFDFGKYVE